MLSRPFPAFMYRLTESDGGNVQDDSDVVCNEMLRITRSSFDPFRLHWSCSASTGHAAAGKVEGSNSDEGFLRIRLDLKE